MRLCLHDHRTALGPASCHATDLTQPALAGCADAVAEPQRLDRCIDLNVRRGGERPTIRPRPLENLRTELESWIQKF